MLTSFVGKALYLEDIPAEDGTYVAQLSNYGRTKGDVVLVRTEELDGYEIGYDAMNLDVVRPMIFAQLGDRIGVWRDNGKLYVDRTVHLRGPQELAENLGREYNQLAIWDWAAHETITLDRGV